MEFTTIGDLRVSRLLLGSNQFSGFSHQGLERDEEMLRYYTVARIKETLFEAERVGMTAFVARTDFHVIRMLREYRDEGGKLAWMAQTCPEVGPSDVCARRAAKAGAVACHIHGGVMDHLVANGGADEVQGIVEMIREKGMKAGVAGHTTAVFEWARENLDVDYYLCCYYNPTPRANDPEHVHSAHEEYRPEDREAMVKLIPTLSRPVVHYKIMAGGRNDPREAFEFCHRHLRPEDLVCVGAYTGDKPGMLEENVSLFEDATRARDQVTAGAGTSRR
jgi:hypothetical protein